jgi:FkbM family methyltransferase
MSWIDHTVGAVAALSRRSPHFRGLGRLYGLFNGLAVRAGAEPLAVAKMRDGSRIRVDLRTNTDLDAYYRGEYDPDLVTTLRHLIDPGGCLLDVGANIGFYAVAIGAHLRSMGAGGRVVAFEPLGTNYQRLRENLELNGLGDCCVTYDVGLSNRTEDAVITLREDFGRGADTGNAALPTEANFDRGFRTAPIRLARLDDIWQAQHGDLGKIDLIKIDIEGHEDYCLEGAQATLAVQRPAILMEVNKPYYRARGVTLDDRFMPLLPANYEIFRLAGGRWMIVRSFGECSELDNVFLVPTERLSTARYSIFKRT